MHRAPYRPDHRGEEGPDESHPIVSRRAPVLRRLGHLTRPQSVAAHESGLRKPQARLDFVTIRVPGANPRVGPTLRPAQPQGHLAPGGQWKCPSGIGTETVTSPPAPTTVFVTVVPKTVMSNVPAK